jgi:hypothetical protein
MVVENVDYPRNGTVGQGDLGAVDLPQVIGRVTLEAPPGRYCATLGAPSRSTIALQHTVNR